MARLGLVVVLLLAQGDVAKWVDQLNSPDYEVRRAALAQLAMVRSPAALQRALRAMPGWSYEGQVYGLSLINAYPKKASRNAHRRLLRCDAPYLRLTAAVHLAGGEEPLETQILVDALGSDAPERFQAAMLVSLRWLYEDWPEPLREAVRGKLKGPPKVISEAIYVLHLQPADTGAFPACRALLEHELPGIRAMAATHLYLLGGGEAEEALVAAMGEPVAATEFNRICTMLRGRNRAPRGVLAAVLERCAKETHAWSRVEAIRLLAHFKHVKAIPVLEELATVENARVAKEAAEAVEVLYEADAGKTVEKLIRKRDVATLRSWLRLPSEVRRLQAADALRRMDDLSALPVVAEILDKGRKQRRRAAEVLGRFTHRDAVLPLVDALLDPDRWVRRKALARLEDLLLALFPYRRLDFTTVGYDEKEPRADAVMRIRLWWMANSDKEW